MSRSRIYTLPSRSYLHEPIQYRQVVHDRNGHSTLNTPLARHLPKPTSKSPHQTQSRLEVLLRQRSIKNNKNSRNHSNLNYSLSLPRATTRDMEKGGTKMISTRRVNERGQKEDQRQQQQILNAIAREQVKLQLQQIKQIPTPPKFKPPPPPQTLPFSPIQAIDLRLQKLVTHKLQLLSIETSKKKNFSYKTSSDIVLQKQALNDQLQQLIRQIRTLKNNEPGDFIFLNQKIRFIETLIAEQNTEAELMKKYYFGLNSNKKKGKIGEFNHRKHKVGEVYIKGHKKQKKYMYQQGSLQHNKPLFQDTTNRSSFKEPKAEDYQSFRYRPKDVSPNQQPLPRSSYQRQFLLQPQQVDHMIINRDHSPYNPASKTPLASIYQKDYRTLKTQKVNYRELDAYKNKIKVLEVSYSPRHKNEAFSLDTSSYYKDVEMSSSRMRSPPIPQSPTELEEMFNKQIHQSESRREFKGDLKHQPSRIKHQSLMEAQYRLKSLFKA